jgi:hypothetical protein
MRHGNGGFSSTLPTVFPRRIKGRAPVGAAVEEAAPARERAGGAVQARGVPPAEAAGVRGGGGGGSGAAPASSSCASAPRQSALAAPLALDDKLQTS